MKRPVVLFVSVLAMAAVGAGCGNGDTGSQDAGTTSATCDSFPNIGSVITPMLHAGPPPAMTGGGVTLGTYVLAGEDFYNGETDSHMWQETFQFYRGNVVKHVGLMDGAQVISAGSYSVSGTTLTLTTTCPQAATISVQYTTTPTTLAFISPDDPNHLQTYYKQ